MIFTVEIVNLLSILNYTTTMDVVICFMGLVVIADFDNFFYNAMGSIPDKDLLTEAAYEELLFTIKKTSSPSANADIKGNELDDPAYTYLKEKQVAAEGDEIATKIEVVF